MPIILTKTKGDNSTLQSVDGGSFLRTTVQKLPYTTGSPFDSGKTRPTKLMKGGQSPNTSVYAAGLDYNAPWDDMGVISANKARAKLMKKLAPSRAAMAVNLAQLNQGLEMIVGRTKQLTTAFMHLKRGNILGFARTLQVKPFRRHLKKTDWRDNVTGTWLEYTFGWSPMIQDIYNVADVFQSDFAQLYPQRGVHTENRIVVHERLYERFTVYKSYKTVCTANIRVINPNLALANHLGLINPAAVVWDLVPFSFVVDWFVKINSFVQTLNDMAGFEFVRPSTTRIIKAEVDVFNKSFRDTGSSGGRRVIREAAILAPTFKPQFQMPLPSLWLAATSTSLAVQVFGKRS